MPRRKEVLSTHVEPEQLVALRALRETTGITVAALVREALDDLLTKRRADLDPQVEMFGDPNER